MYGTCWASYSADALLNASAFRTVLFKWLDQVLVVASHIPHLPTGHASSFTSSSASSIDSSSASGTSESHTFQRSLDRITGCLSCTCWIESPAAVVMLTNSSPSLESAYSTENTSDSHLRASSGMPSLCLPLMVSTCTSRPQAQCSAAAESSRQTMAVCSAFAPQFDY